MSHPDFSTTQNVTIGAGASLSGASTKISGYRLVGLATDAAWDAAKMTFQVSHDGTTFYNLITDTAEYEIAAHTSAAAVAINPAHFIGWDYVKVRSGTSTAATNQVDATVVTLLMMAL